MIGIILSAILGGLVGGLLAAIATFIIGAFVWLIAKIFRRDWSYLNIMAAIYGIRTW